MFKNFNEGHKEIDKELTSLVVCMNTMDYEEKSDTYHKLSESALKLAETKKVLAEAKNSSKLFSAEKILDTVVSVGLTVFVVKHEEVGIITSKVFQSIIRKSL